MRILVYGYTVTAVCLWLAVDLLADRVWPATLLAFGPRWPALLPLLPLALGVLMKARRPAAFGLIALLALAGFVLVFGYMDFRLGLKRTDGPVVLRMMTHNLGEGRPTAVGLDRLMKAEHIDVAALQECPFYDYGPARLGWHFYYGGGLCLVSRYPFVVLDEPHPEERWRRGGNEPDRYEIDAPWGRFQLLNVHLETIRGGLDGLRGGGGRALSQFTKNRDESARQSRAARARIGREPDPTLVAGDFNLPVESAIYRADWGDLENAFSSCGRGTGHTKSAGGFGIRIDHLLMSPRWRCVTARVLPDPYGGDHAPLVVDLALVRLPAKSLILLFALVVAIIIVGALWETLAWRAIYRSALTCGQEVFRAAIPFSGPSPRHAGAVTRQPAYAAARQQCCSIRSV